MSEWLRYGLIIVEWVIGTIVCLLLFFLLTLVCLAIIHFYHLLVWL